ncbi:MAG TPA: extracellular solute-binding protein [Bacillota bacterium]|nr:extracellular solute-binding protein [Bacillota bacterium]
MLAAVQGCGKQQAQQTGQPAVKEVILATTTSTQDSGLLDVLIPKFEQKTGYKVKPIAVGSGAAMEMGKKGEADVLLVHSPKDEKALVDSGVGINYQLIMHNDFIIVGPADDPAGIKGSNAADSFKKIAEKKAVFVSRGDNSGTHSKEKSIWTTAGVKPEGSWYQQSGAGMGQTLNIANDKQGYTLTDRATYLAQKKNIKLVVLSEGDKELLNIYHVMQVNPEKFSKVNKDGAKAFVDFMIDPETQKVIGEFGKDKYGEPLFFPDAGKKMEELGK